MAASNKQAVSGVTKLRNQKARLQQERDNAVRASAMLEARMQQAEKRFDRIEGMLEKIANGQQQGGRGDANTESLKSIFMSRETYDEDPTVALAAAVKYLEDKFDQKTSKLEESVLEKSKKTLASERASANLDQQLQSLFGPDVMDQTSALYRTASQIAAGYRQQNNGELTPEQMQLSFFQAKQHLDANQAEVEEEDEGDDLVPESTEGMGSATPSNNSTSAHEGPIVTTADRKASIAGKVARLMGGG